MTTENKALSLKQAKELIKEPLGESIAGKVDKVAGKGLSTNDYTTAEKTKLSGIEAGANKTTDAHINSLIDAKLGVIENGSY